MQFVTNCFRKESNFKTPNCATCEVGHHSISLCVEMFPVEVKSRRRPHTRFALVIRGAQERVKIMSKVEEIEPLTSA